jgi:large subunit ribosomal protein L21
MYAIVKTGGKQYRVEQGQSLLVERLPVDDGARVQLEPLLYVDGSTVLDGIDGLATVNVEARVVAHERGPKLRIVKFKPKRGYKRRTGHRQELTRLEVTDIKLAAQRGKAAVAAEETPTPVAAERAEAEPEAVAAVAERAEAEAAAAAVEPEASADATPEASTDPAPDASTTPTPEASDGA